MTSSAGRTRYTAVAIALHWIIAAVIATNFGLGLYMAQLEASPAKLRLYSYHKTIGVTIFLLVVFRLIWRLTHRVPAPPPRMLHALRLQSPVQPRRRLLRMRVAT